MFMLILKRNPTNENIIRFCYAQFLKREFERRPQKFQPISWHSS